MIFLLRKNVPPGIILLHLLHVLDPDPGDLPVDPDQKEGSLKNHGDILLKVLAPLQVIPAHLYIRNLGNYHTFVSYCLNHQM